MPEVIASVETHEKALESGDIFAIGADLVEAGSATWGAILLLRSGEKFDWKRKVAAAALCLAAFDGTMSAISEVSEYRARKKIVAQNNPNSQYEQLEIDLYPGTE